jgi:hypothetical protein
MSRLVKLAMMSAAIAVGGVALTGTAGYAHVNCKPLAKTGKVCKFKAYPTIQYTNQDPAPPPPREPAPTDPVDFFSGGLNVKPGGSPCLPDRTVQVVRVSDGVVIGAATTLSDGSWQLPAEDVAAGQYQAKTLGKTLIVTKGITLATPLAPTVVPGHKHKFRCVGAHSGPAITAGP